MTGRFVDAGGQRLALWERSGMGAPILFAHATGFHARCWDQIINRISERQCYAADMRGHGRSSKPAPPYSWRWFGEDMAALARELKLTGALGVGHSMGGHSLVLAASLEPGAFSELLLLDPVIMPREYYRPHQQPPHFARKRKSKWNSPDEMFERFRERAPFNAWDEAVLADYCRWGLVLEGSDYILACPPEVEGSIYENSGQPEANLYGRIEKLDIPVTVVRSNRARMSNEGPTDMAASPTAPDLAEQFRRGRDLVVDCSHFIPMESPRLVADLISSPR